MDSFTVTFLLKAAIFSNNVVINRAMEIKESFTSIFIYFITLKHIYREGQDAGNIKDYVIRVIRRQNLKMVKNPAVLAAILYKSFYY